MMATKPTYSVSPAYPGVTNIGSAQLGYEQGNRVLPSSKRMVSCPSAWHFQPEMTPIPDR